MSGNKVYRGAFSEQLKSFIEEKRMLGCRYVEEERLSYEFDKLSLQYDCSNGLKADLVNEFIKCKPNWQATTQKRHISFIQNFGEYLLRHDIHAFRPGYVTLKKIEVSFKPYIFSHEEIASIRDFLGHTDLKVTQIYSKTSVEMKRRALDKLKGNDTSPPTESKDWTDDDDLMKWLSTLGH